MNIKIVHTGEDWEALYVNKLLYREGHRIEPTDVCSAVIKYGGIPNFTYDEEWISCDDDFTGFPAHYEDLGISR